MLLCVKGLGVLSLIDGSVLLALLLAVGLSSGLAATKQPHAAPLWEHRFDGNIVDVSTPPAASCIAVLTSAEIAVLGYDRTVLWRRDFRKFSRIFQAETVTVAPSCEWVVVTGNASYRYAWLLRKDGRDEHIGFHGVTPLSAAIHPDGNRVAIATGGRHIVMADAEPFAVRKRIPYRGGGQLEYASPDALLVGRYGAGVIADDETVKWNAASGVCDISVPDGAAWSVTACSPPHFSSVGAVTVRGADGAVRWSRILDSPSAAAAPDGSFVAMLGADVTLRDMNEVIGERRLRFVRHDGTALVDVPSPEGNIVGVTGAGLVIVRQFQPAALRAFSKEGTLRATIEPGEWPYGARVAGRNWSMLLLWDRHRLKAFASDAW